MLSVRNTRNFKSNRKFQLKFKSLARSASHALALVCALALASCRGGGSSGLNPGDTAPELELIVVSDGSSAKLSNYFGKKLLLNFWASWCQPCAEEMPELELLQKKEGSEEFVVVAVALEDSLEDLKAFLAKHRVSFPVLFDPSGSARKIYKLGGFPESFLLNNKGQIQLIIDPQENLPVTRIIGPRKWSSPEIIKQIQALP